MGSETARTWGPRDDLQALPLHSQVLKHMQGLSLHLQLVAGCRALALAAPAFGACCWKRSTGALSPACSDGVSLEIVSSNSSEFLIRWLCVRLWRSVLGRLQREREGRGKRK